MTIRCSQCNALLNVPNSSELKRKTGDFFPLLDAVQKIEKTLQQGLSPFDGSCHYCEKNRACVQIPIHFRFLTERHVSENGGLNAGILGPKLTVGAAEEQWRAVDFPLLICAECYKTFMKKWNWASFARDSIKLLLLILLVLFIILLFFLWLVVPLVSITALAFVVLMIFRHRTRKKVDPFIFATLRKVPIVKDAISGEDEYKITFDSPQYVDEIIQNPSTP